MRVTGAATLQAPVERVWSALHDPTVLVRTIPGCEQLEETGPDRYRMTVTAGVASIKGSYTGEVALTDQQHPSTFVLRASGAGAPGTVSADVTVALAQAEVATTRLTYDADAVVGGPIGGVGQRVLSGVAKKTAAEFFRAVDEALAGVEPQPAAPGVPAAAAPPAAAPEPPPAPGIFRAPPQAPRPVPAEGQAFLLGAFAGAAAALLGALVGGLVARRR